MRVMDAELTTISRQWSGSPRNADRENMYTYHAQELRCPELPVTPEGVTYRLQR